MTRTEIAILLICASSVASLAVGGDDPPAVMAETSSTLGETARRVVETAGEVTQQLKSGILNRDLVLKQESIARDLKTLLDSTRGELPSPQPVPGQPGSSSDRPPTGSSSTAGPSGGERRQDDERSAESTRAEQQRNDAAQSPPVTPDDLADAVWGHLPRHERDELIRTFNERYLPKYDAWVRRYFELLAEPP